MLTHQKQSYFCNADIITSHKSGCQGKTFLWAVVAQMFHKVVPAESKVRAQPAHPRLVPPAPLRGWEMRGTWACLESRPFSSRGKM